LFALRGLTPRRSGAFAAALVARQKETFLIEVLVDARGHRCPVPTLRLRRACESAAPGALLRLLADDPLARIDVPHFAAAAGLELVSLEAEGAVIAAVVRMPLK
jgi:tRNA 2-thiouridine synthesizing protein A